MLSSEIRSQTVQICPTRCTSYLRQSIARLFTKLPILQCHGKPFHISLSRPPWSLLLCWFLVKLDAFWVCLFTPIVLLSPRQQSPWWPKIFFSEGRRGELWVAICHNFAWSRHFPWTWKVRGSKKVTNSCSTKISRCWKCILCKFFCSFCTSHLLLEVSFIKAPYVCLMER